MWRHQRWATEDLVEGAYLLFLLVRWLVAGLATGLGKVLQCYDDY